MDFHRRGKRMITSCCVTTKQIHQAHLRSLSRSSFLCSGCLFCASGSFLSGSGSLLSGGRCLFGCGGSLGFGGRYITNGTIGIIDTL
jgi:hypothetical protein